MLYKLTTGGQLEINGWPCPVPTGQVSSAEKKIEPIGTYWHHFGWMRITLNNLGGPDSKVVIAELRLPGGRRNFACGQELQLVAEAHLPPHLNSLPWRFQTCIPSPYTCISQFLAMNLLVYISYWFSFSSWILTHLHFESSPQDKEQLFTSVASEMLAVTYRDLHGSWTGVIKVK